MTGTRKLLRSIIAALILAFYAQSGHTTDTFGGSTSRHDLEEFLRTAKIISAKKLGTGVTNPLKLTLSDGRVERFAVFKSIDDRRKGMTRTRAGMEMDFKDSWMFEIAAYELDKLLSLNMVPVTVERVYDGKKGSVQQWIENAMTEKERQLKKLEPPDPDDWNRQMNVMRIFDMLLYNIDRHVGNVLITPDWKLYMIDHSRSFKTLDKLADGKPVSQFAPSFIEAMKQLTEDSVKGACRNYLSLNEVKTLIKRRDAIIKLFEAQATAAGVQ